MEQEVIKIYCCIKDELIESELELHEYDDAVELKLLILQGEYVSEGETFFEALFSLRKKLEMEDVKILCRGCCRNVFSSGMILSMGAGRKAYVLQMGQQASLKNLVDIFSSCSKEEVVSIDEQMDFYNKWIKSLTVK